LTHATGCGEGKLLDVVVAAPPPRLERLVGVELSADALAGAKRRMARLPAAVAGGEADAGGRSLHVRLLQVQCWTVLHTGYYYYCQLQHCQQCAWGAGGQGTSDALAVQTAAWRTRLRAAPGARLTLVGCNLHAQLLQ
jgi:hypothetical protein